MGSAVANHVKTTILRLQPAGMSLITPIAIEKLETFKVDTIDLATELSETLEIDIPIAQVNTWRTVGDVIANIEELMR